MTTPQEEVEAKVREGYRHMFRTASTRWQGVYAFPFDGFTPLYYLAYEMVDYHGPVYQEKANG